MTDTTDRPLVTFAVIAYNQGRYVREAIESAFAQTYAPLEIILSDDCSPDRTFDIMQEMAAAYDGPHKIVLNRNEPNLGIVPHIDRVMDLVQGEFILVNAGDDISYPQRTEQMATAWLESGRNIALIHSFAETISEKGTHIGHRHPPDQMREKVTPREIIGDALHVVGATAGWDRRVFDEFGPLAPDLEIEDHVIPFRASLIGDLHYIDEALVQNRVGGISSGGYGGVYNNLYVGGHRKRKWILETDEYLLKRCSAIEFEGKAETESICRDRSRFFRVQVELANSKRLRRFLTLSTCCSVALQSRSLRPIKDYLKYNLDWAYIPIKERT